MGPYILYYIIIIFIIIIIIIIIIIYYYTQCFIFRETTKGKSASNTSTPRSGFFVPPFKANSSTITQHTEDLEDELDDFDLSTRKYSLPF